MKRISGIKDIFGTKSSQTWPDVRWIETNAALPKLSSKSKIDVNEKDELAFLQYTSGSTSEPKGVMLTHGNLSHNITTIVKSLKADTKTVVVSWLPQYHDMGLIGSYLSLIYCGGSGVYMSPISFIRNPPMWIESVSSYKGTHLQAPNFAYILSARKFKALAEKKGNIEGFSLSSIKHMFNAAEPVTAGNIYIYYCHKYI
ncbi:MAG: AMP-binding protein [Actinobacteria bacterium]|nr:AMP-binding protein [Actinomycetota bacterium]